MLPVLPSVEADGLPPFAHDEPYTDYFLRLGQGPAPAAALRRLLSHQGADLDGEEQLALWQAQWQAVQRLDEAAREAVGRCLDGRHADHVAMLTGRWDSPALVLHLGRSALAAPARPGAVAALLDHHRLQPLTRPQEGDPALLLLAIRAEMAAADARLPEDRIQVLQPALLVASERDPTLTPQAMACLFELALHARDEHTGTAVLAALIADGHGALADPARVRDWLDGRMDHEDCIGHLPLALSPAWQARWLRPADWQHRAPLVMLARTLRREGPRRRLAALMAALGMEPASRGAAPRDPAWLALTALDGGYDLIENGADASQALLPMMNAANLAPAALAALHIGGAAFELGQGRFEAAVRALARARRLRGDDALRQRLGGLLLMMGSEEVHALPPLGSDWRDEEPFWHALLRQESNPALQRLAGWTLAHLWLDGSLEPGAPVKRLQLEGAQALWGWLAGFEDYAAEAAAVLADRQSVALMDARRDGPGAEHLWFETAGATRLMVVFSCALSYHSYPEAAKLVGQLPGHHLLFVRNAECNWYSDEAFDALCQLVQGTVLPRFAPGQVSCHYGSMGGHGALKLALQFGFRALVFNPQTDLDLWATQRARQRRQLWSLRRHARLDAWPSAAWERMPLYLACGSGIADREALSALLPRLRACTRLTAVIEKFADSHHAGLMQRISQGPATRALQLIDIRLGELEGDDAVTGMQALADDDVPGFWQHLDEARSLKVEIQVREGRLHWQPSRCCGTRASGP